MKNNDAEWGWCEELNNLFKYIKFYYVDGMMKKG